MALELTNQEQEVLKKVLSEELVFLSQEDIKYLKEYVEDRKAYTRVYSKIKIFMIAISSGLLSTIIFFEEISSFIKTRFGF